MRNQLLIALVALVMWGCARSDSFSVSLEIEGIDSREVTMTWTAEGAIHTTSAHPAANGTVGLTGVAAEPTLVELTFAESGDPIADIIACNGDKIKIRGTLGDPLSLTVKGSKPSEALVHFLADNRALIEAGDTRALNDAISSYVAENPTSLASTVLMATRFSIESYERLADSLVNVIDPAARPANLSENLYAVLATRVPPERSSDFIRSLTLHGAKDSLWQFQPRLSRYTVFAFTGRDNSRRDTIERALAAMASRPATSVRVVEVSLLPDSTVWRRLLPHPDTTHIQRTWAPGGLSSQALRRISVPATPYYIVVDSTARRVLSTPSLTAAKNALK